MFRSISIILCWLQCKNISSTCTMLPWFDLREHLKPKYWLSSSFWAKFHDVSFYLNCFMLIAMQKLRVQKLDIFNDIISTALYVGILWLIMFLNLKFMGLWWINKVVQCMIVKKIINKPPRIKRIGWLAISSVGSKFYSMASVSSVKIYNWLEYYHVEVCTQIYRVFLAVLTTCKSISNITNVK